MKKLLLILSILFYTALLATGQEMAVDKTRFVGGANSCGGTDCRYAISTSDKGVFFVGATYCWAGGGDIPPNYEDTSLETTRTNMVVGKLDSNLNVEWVKVYGGSWIDFGESAIQTADGGYAVLAYTFSNNRDVSGNHGTGDLWLVKLDANGNIQWQKCYGSAYDEQPINLTQTPEHDYVLFGLSNGMGDDVPTHYSGSEFDYDWLVIKTDSVGGIIWTRTIGGTGDENNGGNVFVYDNAYYLVGSSNSEDYDCTDTSWHAGQNTGYDYYIFKLDTAGNILWDSSYGGGGQEMLQAAVWDSRDSSIIMNGNTDTNDGSYMVQGNNGDVDMWVVKVDRNGVFKWQKCLGGIHEEIGSGITITPDGYMAYGNTFPGSIGGEDGWIFDVSMTGNEYVNKTFGGTNPEDPFSIVQFRDGYVATGTTGSQSFTEGENIGHENGSLGDAFFTLLYYFPLGISNETSATLNVYPNPCTDEVKVILPQNTKGTVTAMNAIGQIIYQQQTDNKENIQINTTDWQSGSYIIQWRKDDGSTISRTIIKL